METLTKLLNYGWPVAVQRQGLPKGQLYINGEKRGRDTGNVSGRFTESRKTAAHRAEINK